MPEQDLELPLSPGSALYIPPYTPHWITNGDATSLCDSARGIGADGVCGTALGATSSHPSQS